MLTRETAVVRYGHGISVKYSQYHDTSIPPNQKTIPIPGFQKRCLLSTSPIGFGILTGSKTLEIKTRQFYSIKPLQQALNAPKYGTKTLKFFTFKVYVYYFKFSFHLYVCTTQMTVVKSHHSILVKCSQHCDTRVTDPSLPSTRAGLITLVSQYQEPNYHNHCTIGISIISTCNFQKKKNKKKKNITNLKI